MLLKIVSCEDVLWLLAHASPEINDHFLIIILSIEYFEKILVDIQFKMHAWSHIGINCIKLMHFGVM